MNDLTEEQARSMEAGEELDHHCAIWMGYTEDCEYHDMGPDCPPMPEEFYRAPSGEPCDHAPPPFSTDWSAAGPLLEALPFHDEDGGLTPPGTYEEWWGCTVQVVADDGSWVEFGAGAPTAPLAIARACAVLVARGITREEVESG